MRTTLKWIAACFVASLVGVVAAACSSGKGNSVTEVSLAELSANQDAYNGKQVSTSGTVREFSDSGGTYYVLEDVEQHRVALEPTEEAAPYAGKSVTVTGRFAFGQETGRSIELKTITATSPAPSPSDTPGTSDVAQPGSHFVQG